MDKTPERVRRMFGQIAPRYDRMNHLLSMQVDRYWRWRAVRAAAPRPGEPILDACTGTGDLAMAFFRATGGRSPIVGADFCREMLTIGRRKMQRSGAADRIVFVEADAEQLPFEDDRFEIVSVAFGIRNVRDPDRGLREMVRVCRPGGRLAVLEFSHPERFPVKPLYGWYFRRVLPCIGQRLARNELDAYAYLPESVGSFPEGEAFVERMRAAGLTGVRRVRLTWGIASLYIGLKPQNPGAELRDTAPGPQPK